MLEWNKIIGCLTFLLSRAMCVTAALALYPVGRAQQQRQQQCRRSATTKLSMSSTFETAVDKKKERRRILQSDRYNRVGFKDEKVRERWVVEQLGYGHALRVRCLAVVLVSFLRELCRVCHEALPWAHVSSLLIPPPRIVQDIHNCAKKITTYICLCVCVQHCLFLQEDVSDLMSDEFTSNIVTEFKENKGVVERGDVTFRLAEYYGFCWGVERAIAMAFQARKHFPDQVKLTDK